MLPVGLLSPPPSPPFPPLLPRVLPPSSGPRAPRSSPLSDDMEGIESREDAFYCRKTTTDVIDVRCRACRRLADACMLAHPACPLHCPMLRPEPASCPFGLSFSSAVPARGRQPTLRQRPRRL